MNLGYVLDHTALGALGAGNRQLSRMIHAAYESPNEVLYVPALCLVAAVADRPGIAEHVGSLSALDIVELDYPAAATTGRLVARGVDWRAAQAIDVGRPTPDWPHGRPVATAEPKSYAGHGVAVISVG